MLATHLQYMFRVRRSHQSDVEVFWVFFFGFLCVFFFPFFVKFFLVSPCNLDYSVWWAGQRTGSEEESPVAVHPGRAGTEMNAWATVERQMEDGATVHEVG